jgi:hypothetical protein
MRLAYVIATVLSVASFLWYGLACLLADGMVEEFERYGLSRWRRLTGALEVLGASGLLAGQFLPWLVPASAAGLTVLMLLGVITRIRVRDPWYETLPAAVLMGVNAYIVVYAVALHGRG